MGSEPKESSKELLVLEHTSEDAHLQKLLSASSSKPKIERVSSSVLERVQRFLPELNDANESIRKTDGEDGELCCEVGENFEGPAIEMTLMVTNEEDEQMKIVEVLENEHQTTPSDSETDSDEDSDSSSDGM